MSAADQLRPLNQLLAELMPRNRFYTAKLRDVVGHNVQFQSLEEFSQRVPFTTKAELVADQQAHPPFGTNLTYPIERYTRFTQTSGTTGAPLRWLDTPESWRAMLDCWDEVFRAAQVRAGDRILFAFSFGPFLGFWTAFESAARLGCLCIPGGGLSSAARLQVIHDNAVAHLCCTPTYALRLGHCAQQERIDLSAARVRTIIVAGEPGGSVPATRARIEALWPGAQVFDHHGMTEVGPVTFQTSPGNLAIIESAYLAEVIDPHTGRAAPAGQSGELVLTNLRRPGSPLLRYRTGDLVRGVRRDGKFILEGGILGRTDDMVIVRGVNVYPSAIEQIVRACPLVAEYQVAVREAGAMTELEVILEPTTDCRDARAVAGKLETDLSRVLALRIPVSLAAPGSLPRFEFKAQRWIRRAACAEPSCRARASCAACDGADKSA